MTDENKPTRKLADLTPAERRSALRYFRAAIAARRREWDNCAEVETILNREIDFDIDSYACCGGNPSLADLAKLLGEAAP